MSPHRPDSAIYILYIVMVLQISNVVDSHIRFTLCTYVKNIYFSNTHWEDWPQKMHAKFFFAKMLV